MIAEKIKSSFSFSTDAVRCTLLLVNRQFSLPIGSNALVNSLAKSSFHIISEIKYHSEQSEPDSGPFQDSRQTAKKLPIS